jgi:hypothetical protein
MTNKETYALVAIFLIVFFTGIFTPIQPIF